MNCWKVLFVHKALKNTSKNSVDIFDLPGNVFHWLDRSEIEDDDLGDLLSSVLVVLALEILGGSVNVFDDLWEMGKEVFGNSLDQNEGILELSQEVLDFVDFWKSGLAVAEVLVHLVEDVDDDLEGGHDAREILLLEVGNQRHDVVREVLGVLHANLELGEVLLVDEAVDESSDELFDLENWDGWQLGGRVGGHGNGRG